MALTKEDLQAISTLLDEKLTVERENTQQMMRGQLEPIRSSIKDLDDKLDAGFKQIQDTLTEVVDEIGPRVDDHEKRIWKLEQEAKRA